MCNVPEGTVTAEAARVRVPSSRHSFQKSSTNLLKPMRVLRRSIRPQQIPHSRHCAFYRTAKVCMRPSDFGYQPVTTLVAGLVFTLTAPVLLLLSVHSTIYRNTTYFWDKPGWARF